MNIPVSLVVAHEERFGIGKRGSMPWHLPKELKHFRAITMGGVVIMGYNTWASLPDAQKPLQGRVNIVLTSNPSHIQLVAQTPRVIALKDPLNALEKGYKSGRNIYIIGGARIYRYYLEQDLIDRIYATTIRERWDVDTYIPDYTSDFALAHESETLQEEIVRNGMTDWVSYRYQVWQKH